MKIILGLLFFLLSFPACAEAPGRVVSIGGALTEVVYALEAQDLLVGNDTTSYYPDAAKKLPKVGYQRALSAEGILSLNPDLIVLTEAAGPPPVLKQIESTNVAILKLKAARSIDEVKATISSIGQALHREESAEALIAQIDRDSEKLASMAEKQLSRKRVMLIIQHGGRAPMVAGTGTAADAMIDLSGAKNVVKDYQGYKPLTPEAAVALNPDVIVAACPGSTQGGCKEELRKAQGISLTPAAQKGHIIEMDPLLLLGFGPRSLEAAIQLHESYQGR